MALNCAMLSPQRCPIPLPNELDILTIKSGVELTLTYPDGTQKPLKDTGSLYLTDHRVVFVAVGKNNSGLESLTIPYTSMVSTNFTQPTFSANYLTIEIKPAHGGNLADGTKAEIRMKDKGLFELVSVLEKTRERAIYMKRQSADDDEGLPSYTPAEAGPSNSGRIPDDAPPAYDG